MEDMNLDDDPVCEYYFVHLKEDAKPSKKRSKVSENSSVSADSEFLVDEDGNKLFITHDLIDVSEMWKETLLGKELSNPDKLIFVPSHFPQTTMRLLIKFVKMMKNTPIPDIPKPLPNADLRKVGVPEEYCTLLESTMEQDQDLFFDVLTAANFFVIKDLLHLMCAYVGGTIKGKTPDEIRKMFAVTDTLKRGREEHSWAQEEKVDEKKEEKKGRKVKTQ